MLSSASFSHYPECDQLGRDNVSSWLEGAGSHFTNSSAQAAIVAGRGRPGRLTAGAALGTRGGEQVQCRTQVTRTGLLFGGWSLSN